jgi:hypothetical protein
MKNRRSLVVLAAMLAVSVVASCDFSQATSDKSSTSQARVRPSSGATPSAADPPASLCERLRPGLSGAWQASAREPSRSLIPVSDSCWLDPAHRDYRVRLSVSVLPATADDLTAIRKINEFYEALVIKDGEVGPGSWGVNSDEAPYLVFLSGGHLIRVTKEPGGRGAFDELQALARKIDALPPVPPAAPLVRRPECEAGTAAAQKLLGSAATIRRDSLSTSGLVRCLWGTSRATAFAVAGRGTQSNEGQELIQNRPDPRVIAPRVVRVPVGAEGIQHADGISFRVGKDTFVTVGAVPLYSAQPADLLALARAMVPVYNRR